VGASSITRSPNCGAGREASSSSLRGSWARRGDGRCCHEVPSHDRLGSAGSGTAHRTHRQLTGAPDSQPLRTGWSAVGIPRERQGATKGLVRSSTWTIRPESRSGSQIGDHDAGRSSQCLPCVEGVPAEEQQRDRDDGTREHRVAAHAGDVAAVLLTWFQAPALEYCVPDREHHEQDPRAL